MTSRQGRRRKKLLDDLKDRRGYSHLKEEALDRSMWRDRFGRGFEPVVRLLDDDDPFVYLHRSTFLASRVVKSTQLATVQDLGFLQRQLLRHVICDTVQCNLTTLKYLITYLIH